MDNRCILLVFHQVCRMGSDDDRGILVFEGRQQLQNIYPLSTSRFPVGSSARINAGLRATALAMATAGLLPGEIFYTGIGFVFQTYYSQGIFWHPASFHGLKYSGIASP